MPQKVSFLFAPAVLLWFVANFAIGCYNIAHYQPSGKFPSHSPRPAAPCTGAFGALAALGNAYGQLPPPPYTHLTCTHAPPRTHPALAVFRALSPSYMYFYWSGEAHTAWLKLGAIMLAITGSEALFAGRHLREWGCGALLPPLPCLPPRPLS